MDNNKKNEDEISSVCISIAHCWPGGCVATQKLFFSSQSHSIDHNLQWGTKFDNKKKTLKAKLRSALDCVDFRVFLPKCDLAANAVAQFRTHAKWISLDLTIIDVAPCSALFYYCNFLLPPIYLHNLLIISGWQWLPFAPNKKTKDKQKRPIQISNEENIKPIHFDTIL